MIAARASRAANRALQRVERGPAGGPLPQVPVLIVGAPRCGSTLLMQLVAARFDVTFLTNAHCRLFGAPSLVERALRRRTGGAAEFASFHGRVDGALAPSECGPYWYRFFRHRPQHVAAEEADPARMRALRASVAALGRAGRRPVVYKNLVNSLRLGPLRVALPEAIFVAVRRDEAATARSILAARARRGDVDAWWSVEPPGVERLRRLPAAAQAVEQVRAVTAEVERHRAVAPERFLQLAHEETCADPAGALERLRAFAAGHGCDLRPRGTVPDRFDARDGGPLPAPLEADLRAYLAAPEPA